MVQSPIAFAKLLFMMSGIENELFQIGFLYAEYTQSSSEIGISNSVKITFRELFIAIL